MAPVGVENVPDDPEKLTFPEATVSPLDAVSRPDTVTAPPNIEAPLNTFSANPVPPVVVVGEPAINSVDAVPVKVDTVVIGAAK